MVRILLEIFTTPWLVFYVRYHAGLLRFKHKGHKTKIIVIVGGVAGTEPIWPDILEINSAGISGFFSILN